MDASVPNGKCGKICPSQAAFGIYVRSSSHICVDVMMLLFDMSTSMDLMAICLFVCAGGIYQHIVTYNPPSL